MTMVVGLSDGGCTSRIPSIKTQDVSFRVGTIRDYREAEIRKVREIVVSPSSNSPSVVIDFFIHAPQSDTGTLLQPIHVLPRLRMNNSLLFIIVFLPCTLISFESNYVAYRP